MFLRIFPPPKFATPTLGSRSGTDRTFAFLWHARDLEKIAARNDRRLDSNGFKQDALNRADKAWAGEINFLGWGKIALPVFESWHTDTFTRTTWTSRFHKFVDTVRPHDRCDVKRPWELSRLQFLVWYGQAWVHSGKDCYIEYFWRTLRHWLISNPHGFGVNWACSMEVAIRAINVAVAANLFDGALTKNECRWIRKLLSQHYRHIKFNLEISDKNGNHYFFDWLGLALLGTVLHGRSDAQTVRDIELFIDVALNQFHDDGVHVENASGYHRFVLEGLAIFLLCEKRNGYGVPEKLATCFAKASRFLSDICNSNGEYPIIGDADSGNLLRLSDVAGNNAGPLLAICRRLLADMPSSACHRFEEELWLFGANVDSKEPQLANVRVPNDASPERRVAAYSDGGFFVFRTEGCALVVRCGSSGLDGRGSHDHNDQLSVFVELFGVPFVVDPGTFSYTGLSGLHKADLLTSRHSTVVVDELEQAPIVRGSVMSTVRSVTATCERCALEEKNKFMFEGTICCYGGKKAAFRHTRQVATLIEELCQVRFSIVDTVWAPVHDQTQIAASFQIDPRWQLDGVEARAVQFRLRHATARIEIADANSSLSVRRDYVCPEYGAAHESHLVRISTSASKIITLESRIQAALHK
ncbi:MAG: heparinase II/III family protein [Steroidobacteraceae bacterium]